MARTVAVDFDGVIHRYSKGWQDGSIYDEPVPGAFDALQGLYEQGYNLVIFTTRAREEAQAYAVIAWLEQHRGDRTFRFEVSYCKPLAVAYIDDRAIRFTDWPQALADVKAVVG